MGHLLLMVGRSFAWTKAGHLLQMGGTLPQMKEMGLCLDEGGAFAADGGDLATGVGMGICLDGGGAFAAAGNCK